MFDELFDSLVLSYISSITSKKEKENKVFNYIELKITIKNTKKDCNDISTSQ